MSCTFFLVIRGALVLFCVTVGTDDCKVGVFEMAALSFCSFTTEGIGMETPSSVGFMGGLLSSQSFVSNDARLLVNHFPTMNQLSLMQ